jgi:heme-degrading monooxygenase HmoA
MIARTWRGTVRRADAEAYAEYIRETGFAEYGQTPGNRGAWMLRRDEAERTEFFMTLSLWESEDAIRAFAGDDIYAAVPPRRPRLTLPEPDLSCSFGVAFGVGILFGPDRVEVHAVGPHRAGFRGRKRGPSHKRLHDAGGAD